MEPTLVKNRKKTAFFLIGLCTITSIICGITWWDFNHIVLIGDHVFDTNYIVREGQEVTFQHGTFSFSNPQYCVLVYGKFTGENFTLKGDIKCYQKSSVMIFDSTHTVDTIYAYDSAQVTINNSTVGRIYAYNQSLIIIDGNEYQSTSTIPSNDTIAPQVGIIDPHHGSTLHGVVTVRGLIYESSTYSVEILLNGSVMANSIPWIWNTTSVADGWWNLTLRVKDAANNIGQDTILVYILNYQEVYQIRNTWYKSLDLENLFVPSNMYYVFGPIRTNITVFSGDTVFIQFNCQARNFSYVNMSFYLQIDNILDTKVRANASASKPGEICAVSVCFNYWNSSFTPGDHIIDIVIYATSNYMAYPSFLIQTLY